MPKPNYYKSSGFNGKIPVRLEGAPDGPLANQMMLRGVADFEHATLSRAFGLDPATFWFDVASTARGIGSNSGAHSSRRGTIDGFVFFGGYGRPVAKLRVIWEGERLWDNDPASRRDFEDLSHS